MLRRSVLIGDVLTEEADADRRDFYKVYRVFRQARWLALSQTKHFNTCIGIEKDDNGQECIALYEYRFTRIRLRHVTDEELFEFHLRELYAHDS